MKKIVLFCASLLFTLSTFSFSESLSEINAMNMSYNDVTTPSLSPLGRSLTLNTYAGFNAPIANANGSFQNGVLNQTYSQMCNGVLGAEILTPISPVDQIGVGIAYYSSVQLADAPYSSYYNGLPVYLAYRYYFPLFGSHYVPYTEMRAGYNFVTQNANSNIRLNGGFFSTFGFGLQVYDWTFAMDYTDVNASGTINGQGGTLTTQGFQFTIGKQFSL